MQQALSDRSGGSEWGRGERPPWVHRALACALTAALVGCGGGASDQPPPDPPDVLRISGDGQTVAQHQRTGAPLEIQLVDGKLGNAIPGVQVSFFSGTPGVYIAPLTAQTDL